MGDVSMVTMECPAAPAPALLLPGAPVALPDPLVSSSNVMCTI